MPHADIGTGSCVRKSGSLPKTPGIEGGRYFMGEIVRIEHGFLDNAGQLSESAARREIIVRKVVREEQRFSREELIVFSGIHRIPEFFLFVPFPELIPLPSFPLFPAVFCLVLILEHLVVLAESLIGKQIIPSRIFVILRIRARRITADTAHGFLLRGKNGKALSASYELAPL
jgi:hypothetical protein